MPRARAGTGWIERLLRILFGLVVFLFFAGLCVGLTSILALSPPGRVRSATSLPVIAIMGVILFLALVAIYGLDQLLAGIWPGRSRWFTRVEGSLSEATRSMRGRGNLTIARIRGAPIQAHWSLPLGFLLVGGLRPGAWAGFLAVILAHELGHAVLVRRCGQEVVALSFHAFGGECRRAVTYWNVITAGLNLLPIRPLDGAEAWRPLVRPLQPRTRAEPLDQVEALMKSVTSKVARKDPPLE